VILVIAFAVRMTVLYEMKHNARTPILTNAPYGYETGAIAASIARGKGFSSPLGVPSGPTAWLTPVYPYLLAGIFKVYGVYTYQSQLIILTINCLFSALTCVPIFFAGRKLGGVAAGAIAAWVWAFYVEAILTPVQWIWDTSLAALVCACIVWATLEIRDSRKTWHWIGYGALWAFGLMVNAAIASVAPFVLLWLAWPLWKERKNRALLRLPIYAALVIAAGCTPWTVRNLVVMHKLIPLRSNFGLELWLGNNSQVPDTWAGWLHPSDSLEQRKDFLQLGEIEYIHERQNDALSFMKTHPVDTARFFWRRFVENWTTTWDPIQDIWGALPWYERMAFVSNLVCVLAGLGGVLLLFREKNPFALPIAFFPLIFPIVYYVTHPSRRYRHPIDPVLILLTAVAAVHLAQRKMASEKLAPAREALRADLTSQV
jgi:hypothetical protein